LLSMRSVAFRLMLKMINMLFLFFVIKRNFIEYVNV